MAERPAVAEAWTIDKDTPAVVKHWTTYRLADGEQIAGEYSFVTEPEWWDDVDEPTEVVKETWMLVSSETVTFRPYGWERCETCDEWFCDVEAHVEEEHVEEVPA